MCTFLTRWRDPVYSRGSWAHSPAQQLNCQWWHFDLWSACISTDESSFTLSTCDRERARQSQQRLYICFSVPELQWLTASPSGLVLYCSMSCVTDWVDMKLWKSHWKILVSIFFFTSSLFLPCSSLIPHLFYFSVASSQANNQLINQLSPWIIVAALRGALQRPSRL